MTQSRYLLVPISFDRLSDRFSKVPLTWYFLVRPLGFEPRTCGLRVGSEPFLPVSDSPWTGSLPGFSR